MLVLKATVKVIVILSTALTPFHPEVGSMRCLPVMAPLCFFQKEQKGKTFLVILYILAFPHETRPTVHKYGLNFLIWSS